MNWNATLHPASAGPVGESRDEHYRRLFLPAAAESVLAVLDRVRTYLQACAPRELAEFPGDHPGGRGPGRRSPYSPTCYEWGVTYLGMLAVHAATGDVRYRDYVAGLLTLIGDALPEALRAAEEGRAQEHALRQLVEPRCLDDCGSMCAALLRAEAAGVGPDLGRVISTAAEHLRHRQLRLADGTFSRTMWIPVSVWADDLYMSVPALALLGCRSADASHFDDAVRQVLNFSRLLFRPETGLYAHGWISINPDTIDFHWARANGWCVLAMADLLDVLPEEHPGRAPVLQQLQLLLRGLARWQSGEGLWHQLVNRNDSYLETSASAMFVYGFARAINRGWISPVYGSLAHTGWNAVADRVNAQGQVEGTCMGTNFDLNSVYYYQRPASVYAAHGYGPVLLAGAEMLRLLGNRRVAVQDNWGSFHHVPCN